MQNAVTADWEKIKLLQRASAITNNIRENNSRLNHTYHFGDKVLILFDHKESNGRMYQPTEGPYTIVKVNPSSGTVKVLRGTYNETMHICRLKTFHV